MRVRIIIWLAILMTACGLGLAAEPVSKVKPEALPVNEQVRADWTNQFREMTEQIACRDWFSSVEKQAFRKDALILKKDRDPLDVVLRRTQALCDAVSSMEGGKKVKPLASELNKLEKRARKTVVTNSVARLELYHTACALRRRIAFANPLLSFERIVYLKHSRSVRGNHMVDQYLGFNQSRSGGVYILEQPFSDNPRVVNVLERTPVAQGRLKGRELAEAGSFIALDLDYDAKSLLFAFTEAESGAPAKDASMENQPSGKKAFGHYYWKPESAFHVFRCNIDGSGLTQLTDGMWNDYDPCFLPNGRIAFVSERNTGQTRCSGRPLPAAVLHAMMPDGSDIIRLSWHDTNEWHPSVNNDGLLVYTRWDYVDRDSDVAHHIWSCYADGRDPRSFHGNYPEIRELRPWMEMSIRAIPDSHRYIAVATPHHGQAYGSLVLIDPRLPDDGACGQLMRVTPLTHFPESETAPGFGMPIDSRVDKKKLQKLKTDKLPDYQPGVRYGTPWPLSEDFYLCVCGTNRFDLCLMDSFGNRELLYSDPGQGCLDPIPVQPRQRPQVIPAQTRQAAADRPAGIPVPPEGEVLIMNVYESNQAWPSKIKIKTLRVISLFPKDTYLHSDPMIGIGAQSLARGVLGVVPVEDDGSVYFRLPAGVGVYFQLVDGEGAAVQTMRSDTYVHPGERLSCLGCHESKLKAIGRPALSRNMPMALRRAPSVLEKEAQGSYPLTFSRLVQPVLNARCVECHAKPAAAKSGVKPPNLGEASGPGWSPAYSALTKGHATSNSLAWAMCGGNGVMIRHNELQYSIPGKIGARASGLYRLLKAGHHGVKLEAEEERRLWLWMDCNSVFYGAYHDCEKQARGEIVRPKLGVPEWTSFDQLVR